MPPNSLGVRGQELFLDHYYYLQETILYFHEGGVKMGLV